MAYHVHSDWIFEHAMVHHSDPLADIHPEVTADTGHHHTETDSVASVLQALWHDHDHVTSAKTNPPTLSVAENALTVNAGGTPAALPISVAQDNGHATSVTIAGLASYESVTDNLDHHTFTGDSITLSAAQVNSGLLLSSAYTGTDHPVNTLTVTANETIGHHTITSAPQTIVVTDPPASTGSTSTDSTGSTGSSSDNGLTLQLSGDMLNGTDPQVEVFVDGQQVGGTYDVTAHHSQGQTQTLQIAGDFDPSVAHQVQVKLINDAWDGQTGDGHDINVYVESIALNGTTIAGAQGTNNATNGEIQAANAQEAVMDINGTLSFNIPADPPASTGSTSTGSGSTGSTGSSSDNGLTLEVSGDMLNSTDPQIQVYVDGHQVGGTYEITAHHSQGQIQTLQIAGDFDPSVAHQVQVKLVNDAWDGQTGDGHDINVYVESIALNGTTIAGAQGTNNATNGQIQASNTHEAVMDINGTLDFNVAASGSTGSGTAGSGSSTGSGTPVGGAAGTGSTTTGVTGTGSGTGTTSVGGTSGVLPQNIVGEWWWPWGGPTIAQVQAQAPNVNYLSLAGAFSNGNGGTVNDGQLLNDYSSTSALQADIAAWKESGRVIVGMVGGGGDSTTIDNATDAAHFLASAEPIIKQLGLQGVDFDLENTPDPAALASVITQLKADFGPDFIIAMSPRPFELRPGGVYREVIQDAGINNIDLIQPQDYALNGDSLSAQQSYMNSDMSDWINTLHIPANKLLIGSFDPQEGESLSTAIQTFTYYKGQYPTLRGSMYWESSNDGSQNGWQWSSEMSQAEQG